MQAASATTKGEHPTFYLSIFKKSIWIVNNGPTFTSRFIKDTNKLAAFVKNKLTLRKRSQVAMAKDDSRELCINVIGEWCFAWSD